MASQLLTERLPARKPSGDRVTFDEFCILVNEDQKADLIDGVIIMTSPASDTHEDLFGFLYSVLRTYVSRKKLGTVRGSRTAIQFSTYDAPEPDLVFISAAQQNIIKEQQIEGDPDLVSEIVSRSSRAIDYGDKKSLYARSGVREYWLIDRYRQTAEFFRNDAGQWTPLHGDTHGIVRSEVVTGFWLRTDWLFAEELPDILEVAATILQAPLQEA
jgi:Uma2 family endonuclease